jgi:hypothetical protein
MTKRSQKRQLQAGGHPFGAGGQHFEPVLTFRVAAPSRSFEGAEDLVYFLSDDLNLFSPSRVPHALFYKAWGTEGK